MTKAIGDTYAQAVSDGTATDENGNPVNPNPDDTTQPDGRRRLQTSQSDIDWYWSNTGKSPASARDTPSRDFACKSWSFRPANCYGSRWCTRTRCCTHCDYGYDTKFCTCYVKQYSSPAPSNSGGGGGCFPSDATVQVFGRGDVRMDELQYGDLVRSLQRSSGREVYAPVYLFGHRSAAGSQAYVHVTAGGRTLAATPGHFLPVCTAGCTPEGLERRTAVLENRRAGDVREGDTLLLADPSPAFAPVSSVDTLLAGGAYNPYVRGADIIVDGVVASPHSDWILDSVAPAALVPYLPYVYEALLAPVYGLYRLVGPATAEWLAHGLGVAEACGTDRYGAAGFAVFLAGLAAPVAVSALAGRALVKAKQALRV
ncbi:hypothetical protein GPECTOR_15g457 [Gonium pectorale]|uniref:Hint domain-containing protein n=1 Tax=Gonium pectorale TaxID=33097 RepID=A0A150GLX7_GONPE|nr:hypothetical protein GPECTOR_15g457 [Gonium pectorale]|eukprot:KXZ50772.1 hypothetical protein GPECTOR_15g457 [Gonium pectorale]